MKTIGILAKLSFVYKEKTLFCKVVPTFLRMQDVASVLHGKPITIDYAGRRWKIGNLFKIENIIIGESTYSIDLKKIRPEECVQLFRKGWEIPNLSKNHFGLRTKMRKHSSTMKKRSETEVAA